ncbi:hypothetical protein D3C86_1409660 [compost metagenome]
MPGAADVQGEIFFHHLHAQPRQGRFRAARPQLAHAFVERRNAVGQTVGTVARNLWDFHFAHDVIDHVPQWHRRSVADVVYLAQRRAAGQQTAEQRFIEVLHAGEIGHVETVADDGQAALALHFQQAREDAHVAGTGHETRAQGQGFQTELLGAEDFLLRQVFGRGVGMLEALGHLFFGQTQVIATIEVDRGRRQVHQTPHPLFQAGLDHIFGDLHVALMKVLITPPQTDGAGAVHHGLNVGAQFPGKFRVTQVALNELGATPNQMLHTFGPATVDPHVQALLQGETRKAPADEAACAGDQNLHVVLRIFRFALCILRRA